ncbi:MAG TPA: tripartite tricarboxylate transporter substrate binding protein [Xanthobacteraceae bacterium]|jgi:tripartite-type tricarboxylate transporter receptor subunit TctC
MTALLRAITVGLVVLSGALSVRAESYPTRQVELVVAYPAGGAADVIARSVAQQLSQMWGETVVVDNRGGGATQIAAKAVAQSPGDGYRLLVTGMETFAIAPSLYGSKLPYDRNDFIPVSSFGYSNQILVVPASSPLKNIADLLSEARKQDGGLQYGTVGIGGSSHVNMVLLESLAGVKLTPVHYRGGGPLLNDLVGDHVPMGFLSIVLVDQNIKAGRLRGLAVGSKGRLKELPDLPTVAETVPGFEAVSWFGLFAPKGTSAEIVQRINTDVQKIFADPEYKRKFLTPNFLNVLAGSPKDFASYIDAESAKWSAVIKAAHLKIE